MVLPDQSEEQNIDFIDRKVLRQDVSHFHKLKLFQSKAFLHQSNESQTTIMEVSVASTSTRPSNWSSSAEYVDQARWESEYQFLYEIPSD